MRASVSGAKDVSMASFEYAKDKIMMGVERKSAIVSPETMKMTAFHEAGHALVALKTDGADPVHKVRILTLTLTQTATHTPAAVDNPNPR